ncbi:GNAT family N-acetyltransferase [Bacillus sp. V59.32b]|uniref:GNAT family N-acetyltransferase n=1 Tax=Bacillus sp. V59.32b TaxID=1758642 RepID=UPI000E3DF17B|nr:GNAT family protein [Bacillus sp. V59.32b]RFU66815.1 N-acetyltransferase [Bacillus sp. V59.32b]
MFLHHIDQDLSLRLLNEKDAEELYRLIDGSRDHLREWLGWVDYIQDVNDSGEFIHDHLNGVIETGGFLKSAGILYKGSIAGIINYNDIHKQYKIGVIGYWLGEPFQGKGIMTRACKEFVNYGFTELGLNRIEIRAAPENKKSKAIPEKLGFTKEGQIRQAERLYDHYVDHVVYGMLANEWRLSKRNE